MAATGGGLAGFGGKGGGGVAGSEYMPYVIGVSPTYYRQTQRLDLTRLCQTLMNVPRFLWIVVEDSTSTSEQVKEILANCKVNESLPPSPMPVSTTCPSPSPSLPYLLLS